MSIKGSAESYIELRGELNIPDAIRGKSAYEIAVMHGFDGTEEEWLLHLERAQAEEVEEAAEQAKTDISEAKKKMLSEIELAAEIVQTSGDSETAVMSQKAVTDALHRGYEQKSASGNVLFLAECDPFVITDLSKQKAILHGRNFFDLDNASFATNSYSANHTLTKENGGIKVVCSVTVTSAYTREATTFTAPFTGLLYCSCEADCDGDIRDVIFLVKVNGEDKTKCYGKGLLYQAVEVTEGDTVDLMFYTHVGTSVGNTVYYKNIQCAYGGLYEYAPYSKPITNAIKTFVLPAVFDDWYTDITHPDTGGLFRFTTNASIADMVDYPVNNDSIPHNVKVSGANLVPYNEVYMGVEGVGINTAGKVTLFVRSLQSRNDLPAYLENNPISITYEPIEGAETQYIDFEYSDVCQGKVIELETAQAVTYYHKPTIEKKYTCVCFGDSFTGMFADKTDYPSMMERDTDLACLNVGFSGSQLTDHSNVNYLPFSLNRLVDAVVAKDFTSQEAKAATCGGLYPEHLSTLKSIDFSKVDFVTVFFGTNDWGSSVPLKSVDDANSENKQHTNVEDALVYSVKKLLAVYPHLRFVVVTPYWRSVSDGKDSDIDSNARNAYLGDFADYIQEVSEKSLHLPTINLYKTSGANVLTDRYYTSDGTHPTEMMKRIISKKILEKIEEIK